MTMLGKTGCVLAMAEGGELDVLVDRRQQARR
jgi:hypothetical protein